MESKEFLRTTERSAAGIHLPVGFAEDIYVPPGKNRIDIAVYHAGRDAWEILDPTFNARTATGASWQAQVMGSAAGVPANYVALTADSTAVANGDSTLTSEITTNGLGRAVGTYGTFTAQGSLGSTFSYKITNTFTYSSTGAVVVAKAALFTASSGGVMAFAAVLSQTATVNNTGDQIALSWTVTG